MVLELVYESRNSRILLQENEEFGIHVIKILNDEFPTPQAVNHFYNEYDILSPLSIGGVRRVLGRAKINNRHALYLQYIDGITLKEYARTEPPLADKLRVSIVIAQVLEHVHQQNVIHKDLTPANILVLRDTCDIFLIDFGISSKFVLRSTHAGNPERLEGTLMYISPEQTGRMNRQIDYRTDLYSLGVILYELFTGQLPFDACIVGKG